VVQPGPLRRQEVAPALYSPRLSIDTAATYPTSSGRATAALVLGIIGLLGGVGSCCCCLTLVLSPCSPVAWYLGHQELRAIVLGRAPASGEGNARAGMICGIIGTALMAVYLVGIAIYVAVVGYAVALEALKQGGLPLPQ
jgi:hypothetical protein